MNYKQYLSELEFLTKDMEILIRKKILDLFKETVEEFDLAETNTSLINELGIPSDFIKSALDSDSISTLIIKNKYPELLKNWLVNYQLKFLTNLSWLSIPMLIAALIGIVVLSIYQISVHNPPVFYYLILFVFSYYIVTTLSGIIPMNPKSHRFLFILYRMIFGFFSRIFI
jgi:hypothetical protein